MRWQRWNRGKSARSRGCPLHQEQKLIPVSVRRLIGDLGLETNYQYIVQGIVIIVSIALDIQKYIAKK